MILKIIKLDLKIKYVFGNKDHFVWQIEYHKLKKCYRVIWLLEQLVIISATLNKLMILLAFSL